MRNYGNYPLPINTLRLSNMVITCIITRKLLGTLEYFHVSLLQAVSLDATTPALKFEGIMGLK
jgi:hypothetical protein